MPSTHRFVSEWSPEFFLNWAARINPDVRNYIQMVLDGYPYPEQAYKSCLGILGYDKKAGRERLIQAVRRAEFYNSCTYSVITRILSAGLDRIPPDNQEKPAQSIEHENVRGAENYE